MLILNNSFSTDGTCPSFSKSNIQNHPDDISPTEYLYSPGELAVERDRNKQIFLIGNTSTWLLAYSSASRLTLQAPQTS